MIIRTLTCHDVYNYGASLQAFALMKFLVEEGHDVKILNYKPDYLNAKFRFSWYVNENSIYYNKCKNNILYKFSYCFRRYIKDLSKYNLKKAFDRFHKRYYILSNTYNSYLDLAKRCPEADVYIVGSDQVWNNDTLNNGWDPAFYLQFGSSKTKRISYAASFGSSKQLPDVLKYWFFSFDAVSIREPQYQNYFEKIGIDAKVVCDPVFLFAKDAWQKYLGLKAKEEKYILVYDLSGNNKKMLADAKILASVYNCKIKNIALTAKKPGVQNVYDIGPDTFLDLIYNAAFVLSDSFHATSFSLIFNKEFFTYQFKNERASRRMVGIITRFGLQNRYMAKDILAESRDRINYGIVSKLIDDFASLGKNWLKDNIG